MKRLLLRNVPGWVLDLLDTLTFGATIVGATYISVNGKDTSGKVVFGAVVFLVLFYFWILLSRRMGGRYSFRTGSKAEANFFCEWYGRQGRHFVFCNDLDWLEDPAGSSIRSALETTARRAGSSVFIAHRVGNASVSGRLRAAGVQLVTMPSTLQAKARFSLREYEQDAWLIVRDKAQNEDNTVFLRSQDAYMLAIARDFFRSTGANL